MVGLLARPLSDSLPVLSWARPSPSHGRAQSWDKGRIKSSNWWRIEKASIDKRRETGALKVASNAQWSRSRPLPVWPLLTNLWGLDVGIMIPNQSEADDE